MSNPLSHIGQTARPEHPLPQEQQQDQQQAQRQGLQPQAPPERGGTDKDATPANDDDL